MRWRRKPKPTPLSSSGPAEPEPSGEGTAKGSRRSSLHRHPIGNRRSSLQRGPKERETDFGPFSVSRETSRACSGGDPERVPSKFASVDRPGNPERASALRREPEREPTEAARPRPEPDPRHGGKLRQTVRPRTVGAGSDAGPHSRLGRCFIASCARMAESPASRLRSGDEQSGDELRRPAPMSDATQGRCRPIGRRPRLDPGSACRPVTARCAAPERKADAGSGPA